MLILANDVLPDDCAELDAISDPSAILRADARRASELFPSNSVDCIVTSPPYWKKRDYDHPLQLGQEDSPAQFAGVLVEVMIGWRPLLKESSSLFVNLGDSVQKGSLAGVTSYFEIEALAQGWKLISRIVWAKTSGMPNPHGRLPQRSELIYHFAAGSKPFIDIYAYGREFDVSRGDIWDIGLKPTKNAHLAPFPQEIAQRAILLTCPERVCRCCGAPLEREVARGQNLNPDRPQAQRAMKLFEEKGLTQAHLVAIRATGICDAGKALQFQNGAGRNSAQVMALAAEAKVALGGYFREFTFALLEMSGWKPCSCGKKGWKAGFVFDPFAGTGTTLRAAKALKRKCGGLDLKT